MGGPPTEAANPDNWDWLPTSDVACSVAAITYARMGRRVLPLHTIRDGRCTCGKRCPSPGKHPISELVPHGVTDASSDPEVVAAWMRAYPDTNLGLAMGDGWLCIDVDGAGHRVALERQHGPWPFTLRAYTGRVGGEHWIFAAPPEFDARAKLAPHVDVKLGGGYIVVAPSLHLSGRRYRWVVCASPLPMPAWMAVAAAKPVVQATVYVPSKQTDTSALNERQQYAQALLERLAREVAAAHQGARNSTLNKAWFQCGQFADALDKNRARSELLRAALSSGLDECEAKRVLR